MITNRRLVRAAASLVAILTWAMLGPIAHAQDDAAPVPPPPVTTTPAPILVAQPQPQTVYVQADQPVYTQAVYTETPAPRRRGPNLGLVIGGSVMLGVGWVVNIVGSLFAGVHVSFFGSGGGPSGVDWDRFRYVGLVPVLGPWIQLGIQPTSFDNDGWGPYLIIDGLVQAAGLAMLIVGIVSMNDGDDRSAEGDDGVSWALVPTFAPGQAGVAAIGRF